MSAQREQLAAAYRAGLSSAQGVSGADLDQAKLLKEAGTTLAAGMDGARLTQIRDAAQIAAGPVV